MALESGTDRKPSAGTPAAVRLMPGRLVPGCLAILSGATAVVHFAVAGEHFQEYWLFGILMLATAWLQLAWAVGMAARPSRLLIAGGTVLNLGIVGVYVITRTVGDVIGPTPHDIEPVGFGDCFCTVLEAAVVAGSAWLLLTRGGFRLGSRARIIAWLGVATIIAVFLSIALLDGGPEMVMTG